MAITVVNKLNQGLPLLLKDRSVLFKTEHKMLEAKGKLVIEEAQMTSAVQSLIDKGHLKVIS